jgi:hypothetical protein
VGAATWDDAETNRTEESLHGRETLTAGRQGALHDG